MYTPNFEPLTPREVIYASTPWACVHYQGRSEILAWPRGETAPVVVAETRDTTVFSAKSLSELIVRAINNYEKTQHLLLEFVELMEECLTADKVSGTIEREAEDLIARAQGDKTGT